MAEFNTFWFGAIFFFICCVVAFIMSFYGGYFIDYMVNKQSELPGSDSSFATQTENLVFFYINLYYMICYCIPILGAIIFGQAILKRVRVSAYNWR